MDDRVPPDRRAAGSHNSIALHRLLLLLAALAGFAVLIGLLSRSAAAQEVLQPGEAYVTRFSGTTTQDGRTVIDTGGTVGSILNIRTPDGAPRGEHWWNEPQRLPVTAAR